MTIHLHSVGLRGVPPFGPDLTEIQFAVPPTDQGQWIVIVGRPGTGKSQLIHRIGYMLSMGQLESADVSVVEHDEAVERRWFAAKYDLIVEPCIRHAPLAPLARLLRSCPNADDVFAEWCKVFAKVCGMRVIDAVTAANFGYHPSVAIAHSEERGPLPLNQLGDSTNSMLGLLIDMACQWLETPRGDTPTPSTMTGVVVVDGLDAHLHPSQQCGIISALRAAFPKLSFVVSVNQPLTLHGTKPGEVYALRRIIDADDRGTVRYGDVRVQQIDVPPGFNANKILTGPWFDLGSTLDQETLDLLQTHALAIFTSYSTGEDPLREARKAAVAERIGYDLYPAWEDIGLSAWLDVKSPPREFTAEERVRLRARVAEDIRRKNLTDRARRLLKLANECEREGETETAARLRAKATE